MKEIMKRMQGAAGILIIGGSAVMLSATGCSSMKRTPPPPLLDDRGMIPAPYLQPGDEVPEEPSGFADDGMDFVPPTPTEMGEPDMGGEGIELPPPVEAPTVTYTVKKGDSLWKISRRYGVSFKELAAYNDMEPDDTLVVGKKLVIPPGGKLVEDTGPAETGVAPSAGTGTGTTTIEREPIPSDRKYTVKSGDNLWVIARRFGVKVADLKRVNDLDSDMIHVGDVLVLPTSAQSTTPERTTMDEPTVDDDTGGEPVVETTHVEPGTEDAGADEGAAEFDPLKLLEHTVLPGDTLEEVADMYGTTVSAIKRANPGIESDADLVENMTIKVPFE